MKRAITTFALLMISLASAQDASTTDPKELISLRESWTRAREQAISPIDRKYLDALAAMKVKLTKSGDLNGALAVEAEIKEISLASESVVSTSKKLSNKKRDEIEAALQGSWTWQDGNSARIAKSVIYKGQRELKYEINSDGTIQVFDESGAKLDLLTLDPGMTTFRATDVSGASWEGKRQ